MVDVALARRTLFTALSSSLSKALALYELDPTSSHFDTIASLTEACSNAGLPLKKSHRMAVASIAHFENPYYYLINPDTGAVRHTIGGGIPHANSESNGSEE
jgi:hypothetical protein